MAALALPFAVCIPSAHSALSRSSQAGASSSSIKTSFFASNLKQISKPSSALLTTTRKQRSSVVVCKVAEGDTAPAFTLKDQNDRSVSLAKFKGKNVVLYFYPADDTPGCTKQACSFRDAYTEFKKAGAEVVGVSSDSPESHRAFAKKHNLPYTLLSDEGGAVRKEWGIKGDFFGALAGRQTYVIDKKGIVKLVFNNQFQPEKHIDETLAILSEMPVQRFL
eukprot:jgi/Mesen1/10877/ME000093S10387